MEKLDSIKRRARGGRDCLCDRSINNGRVNSQVGGTRPADGPAMRSAGGWISGSIAVIWAIASPKTGPFSKGVDDVDMGSVECMLGDYAGYNCRLLEDCVEYHCKREAEQVLARKSRGEPG